MNSEYFGFVQLHLLG